MNEKSAFVIECGRIADEQDWPQVHEGMAKNMVELEKLPPLVSTR
jgi:hypothetical protein